MTSRPDQNETSPLPGDTTHAEPRAAGDETAHGKAPVPPSDTSPVSPDGDSAPSAVARHFPQIEGYRIAGILGHGGMGIVYRAVQQKLDRVVALKVLPAVVGTANPAAVARFRREASAAARLHHPNIVPIYDFGESQDTYYFAMELITGRPLNQLIPRFAGANLAGANTARLWQWLQAELVGGSAEPPREDSGSRVEARGDSASGSSSSSRKGAYFRQVAHWMSDAADALHYAHGQHIIHRDVKPGNLLIASDMRLMIADFGLAKTDEHDSYTATGSLIGTLCYLSPEQAMAKRIRVDHRTDVYSLGATMYELLCFQPAFTGRDDKEILGAIIARDPIPPQRVLPAVPAELGTICLKCMEKNPDARYATARELVDDLHRFLHDLPIVARPPGLTRRVRKFVRRHRLGVIMTVAGVLVTAAAFMSRRAAQRWEEARKQQIVVRVDALITEAENARVDRYEKLGFEACTELYESALELDPFDVRALGNFAILKKDWYNSRPDSDPALLTQADQLLDRALAVQPDQTLLWNVKGVILKKLDQFEDAATAYNAAIALQPDESAAWENLGVVLALGGDLAGAREKLERSCELAGTGIAQCESPWQNLAAVELALGDARAMERIENALVCKRACSSAVAIRAMCRLELEPAPDVDEVLMDADRADFLAADPDTDKTARARIKRVLALAQLRAGRYASAIAASKAAVDLGDSEAFNFLIQAIAEARLGNSVVARARLLLVDEHWPPALKEPGAFDAVAPTGVLWIDSSDALHRLRREVEAVLTSGPDAP